MWWLKKVRHANLNPELRDAFNAFGILGMTDCLVKNVPPAPGTGHKLGMDDQAIKRAGYDWIKEYSDKVERRDNRLEVLEWAILIFVGGELIIDFIRLIWGR